MGIRAVRAALFVHRMNGKAWTLLWLMVIVTLFVILI
jgi:hypothetical protein